ncbi:MAG TPA: hypothetical protein VMH04_19755 [Candidatus Solibacter sp.]|nr:hypothetical protein [Candidatus Solibacter sp.]
MPRRILATLILASAVALAAQDAPLKTAAAVLDRYKQALGGADAIAKVQSETIHGEVEGAGITFIHYAKPFKTLTKATTSEGKEILQGFDGNVSWSLTPQGANIDKETAPESIRRDADLQYPLHQPDYFTKLELAGVTDFEGHQCYWLHGTTHWGKDNNQFYDIKTGLLVGYRFQVDTASNDTAVVVFDDYKSFGGQLVATKNVSRSGGQTQTYIYKSVSYEPLADSLFDAPQAVKLLMK